MPLIRWTPSLLEQFGEFDDMFKSLAPLSSVSGMFPALDIYQDEKSVIIEAQLAGVNPDDVTISVEHDTLTLEGKIEKQTEVDEQNYYRKEIKTGRFHRVVALPVTVMGEQAEAVYDQGVLKITIPKEIKKQKNAIKIAVSKK